MEIFGQIPSSIRKNVCLLELPYQRKKWRRKMAPQRSDPLKFSRLQSLDHVLAITCQATDTNNDAEDLGWDQQQTSFLNGSCLFTFL